MTSRLESDRLPRYYLSEDQIPDDDAIYRQYGSRQAKVLREVAEYKNLRGIEMKKISDYCNALGLHFLRRLHAETLPSYADQSLLSKRFVNVDALLDQKEQLRESGVSQRLVDAAELSALTAVILQLATQR